MEDLKQPVTILSRSPTPLFNKTTRGPVLSCGDCLAPEYPAGTMFWVDPERAPVDGDLVQYRFTDQWIAHLKEAHGIDVTGGFKYWRVINSTPMLESNEGIVPWTPEWIILGVVVATLHWRHPPEHMAARMAQNAQWVADAERRFKASGVRTPLDDVRAVRK
jgi:hypothetical protein